MLSVLCLEVLGDLAYIWIVFRYSHINMYFFILTQTVQAIFGINSTIGKTVFYTSQWNNIVYLTVSLTASGYIPDLSCVPQWPLKVRLT